MTSFEYSDDGEIWMCSVVTETRYVRFTYDDGRQKTIEVCTRCARSKEFGDDPPHARRCIALPAAHQRWTMLRRLGVATCTCPGEPAPDMVAVSCPVHFGDGWGHCVPHYVDTETLVAAVGARGGVGLCAACLEAGR